MPSDPECVTRSPHGLFQIISFCGHDFHQHVLASCRNLDSTEFECDLSDLTMGWLANLRPTELALATLVLGNDEFFWEDAVIVRRMTS